MKTALQKTVEHIQDRFRDERKYNEHLVLQGLRIERLVKEGRYGFMDACKHLNVTTEEIRNAFMWLLEDNTRMNVEHDTNIHHHSGMEYSMIGWFIEQEEAKIYSFLGAENELIRDDGQFGVGA